MIVKVNGGYGKNKETGLTSNINWKNDLRRLWEFVNNTKDKQENLDGVD